MSFTRYKHANLIHKKIKNKNMQISLALDDDAHANTLNDKPRKRRRNALNQTAGSFTHVFHEGFCSEKKKGCPSQRILSLCTLLRH
jgi:hypothetical protein